MISMLRNHESVLCWPRGTLGICGLGCRSDLPKRSQDQENPLKNTAISPGGDPKFLRVRNSSGSTMQGCKGVSTEETGVSTEAMGVSTEETGCPLRRRGRHCAGSGHQAIPGLRDTKPKARAPTRLHPLKSEGLVDGLALPSAGAGLLQPLFSTNNPEAGTWQPRSQKQNKEPVNGGHTFPLVLQKSPRNVPRLGRPPPPCSGRRVGTALGPMSRTLGPQVG